MAFYAGLESTFRGVPSASSDARLRNRPPDRLLRRRHAAETRHAGHYAYVKIAEGCDYKCAFCIIPKMRGHYRSRSIDSIVKEAQRWRRRASRSCCSSHRTPLLRHRSRRTRGASETAARLNEVDGIEWIRLLYLYPTTITTKSSTPSPPGQGGEIHRSAAAASSDAGHKQMKRPGTRQSYVRLLENIRARIPTSHCAPPLSSGFPAKPLTTSRSSKRSSKKSVSTTSASSPTRTRKAPPRTT